MALCLSHPSSGLIKFRHGPSIVATCQLSSTKVDARCDKLATVASSVELSWQYLQRSTDELGQFIAITMQLRQPVWRVHLRQLIVVVIKLRTANSMSSSIFRLSSIAVGLAQNSFVYVPEWVRINLDEIYFRGRRNYNNLYFVHDTADRHRQTKYNTILCQLYQF